MAVVDASDFDSVADEAGEEVTIYNSTETLNEDYGSLTAETLGDGTDENVYIEPQSEWTVQQSQGRKSRILSRK